jgi:hypothetical protein
VLAVTAKVYGRAHTDAMNACLSSLYERIEALRSRLEKLQGEEYALLMAIAATEQAASEMEAASGVIPFRKPSEQRRHG